MTGSEIRSSDDVRSSDAEVRRYGDDTLYAYRDGDEHVVVYQGEESWTKRVPAQRSATIPEERLWTVPDNWSPKLEIEGDDGRDYAVYWIPDPEIHVLLSVPVSVDADEAWYGVESVGKLRLTLDDTLDQYELSAALSDIESEGDYDEGVVEALRRTERQWLIFKRDYRSHFDERAPEAFWDAIEGNGTPRIDGWTVDPWDGSFDVTHLLEEALDIDEGISTAVAELLVDVGAIPDAPAVEVTVDEDVTFPDCFDLQGLIEAGCSPAAAVDYAMVVRSEGSLRGWAETRNVDPDTVGDSVREARQQLQE